MGVGYKDKISLFIAPNHKQIKLRAHGQLIEEHSVNAATVSIGMRGLVIISTSISENSAFAAEALSPFFINLLGLYFFWEWPRVLKH